MDDGKQITRKSSPPIKVYCLPDEKEQIEAQARAAGLSSAAYLRQLGLGFEVRGILDYEKVDELAKISADLGRLGGLLKMWLSNDERLQQFSEAQIEKTIKVAMERIEEGQEEIRRVMQAVLMQPR
ncbi:conjugal transfer transcriptional regulator TraJ [Halomonas elongata]|uniref:conjugal transfer transcriptional regulator TraJ n=1 Tax=Halomonas elongata TaxID=2746 RepID=UPI003358CEEB